MAEFGSDLNSFILEPSSSEVKSNMQLIDDMITCRYMDLSSDHQQLQFPHVNCTDDIQSPNFLPSAAAIVQPPELLGGEFKHQSNKEKSSGNKKRKRNKETEEPVEKSSEVIHVRVKRGQATDSHSLAERVRRQKINERLRCLQNLVPGCYKTMGMAVMLDVIIQYIQSLQNQIEFLSMKLSAASSICDINSLEVNVMENMMQGGNVREAVEVERNGTEGYGGISYFHPTWPF